MPEDDMVFLDGDAARSGESRSSAVHRAIGVLCTAELEEAYTDAWREWETGEDTELWGTTVADGVGNTSRRDLPR